MHNENLVGAVVFRLGHRERAERKIWAPCQMSTLTLKSPACLFD